MFYQCRVIRDCRAIGPKMPIIIVVFLAARLPNSVKCEPSESSQNLPLLPHWSKTQGFSPSRQPSWDLVRQTMGYISYQLPPLYHTVFEELDHDF